MKQWIITLLAGAVLALSLHGVVVAGQLEDGQAAYQNRDYAEAMRLLRPLAETGDADAQAALGKLYVNGQGVPRDEAKAAAFYRMAAEQEHADAQNNLGAMYRNGRGVPQNYVLAHLWFELAASRASDVELRDMAVRNLGRISAEMTPAQIAEAEKGARVWKPKCGRACP